MEVLQTTICAAARQQVYQRDTQRIGKEVVTAPRFATHVFEHDGHCVDLRCRPGTASAAARALKSRFSTPPSCGSRDCNSNGSA